MCTFAVGESCYRGRLYSFVRAIEHCIPFILYPKDTITSPSAAGKLNAESTDRCCPKGHYSRVDCTPALPRCYSLYSKG